MEQLEISGVGLIRPKINSDHRGSLDVIFVDSWAGVPTMSQWNIVRSQAGVLRGLHAHSRYDELYTAVLGTMLVGLKDARHNSATFGRTALIALDQSRNYAGVLVPAGVLHGVLFETPGILAYGLSSPWDGEHEFNCSWNDPDVGIVWPTQNPVLSERDACGGFYRDMVAALSLEL